MASSTMRSELIAIVAAATANEFELSPGIVVGLILDRLRNPDKAMLHAMAKAMSPGRRPTEAWMSVADKHKTRWQAAIDAIAEPGDEAAAQKQEQHDA